MASDTFLGLSEIIDASQQMSIAPTKFAPKPASGFSKLRMALNLAKSSSLDHALTMFRPEERRISVDRFINIARAHGASEASIKSVLKEKYPARLSNSKQPSSQESATTRKAERAAADRQLAQLEKTLRALASPNGPYAHLARDPAPTLPTAEDQAAQILAAADLARAGGHPPKKPKGLAAEICAAADLARLGGRPAPAPTGLAKQIVDAGKKRRGEC